MSTTDNTTITNNSIMTDNSTMTDNSIKTDNSTMTIDAASDTANDETSDEINNGDATEEEIASFNATNVYAIMAAEYVRPISTARKALNRVIASKK